LQFRLFIHVTPLANRAARRQLRMLRKAQTIRWRVRRGRKKLLGRVPLRFLHLRRWDWTTASRRLFGNAKGSDGGIQGAVAKASVSHAAQLSLCARGTEACRFKRGLMWHPNTRATCITADVEGWNGGPGQFSDQATHNNVGTRHGFDSTAYAGQRRQPPNPRIALTKILPDIRSASTLLRGDDGLAFYRGTFGHAAV